MQPGEMPIRARAIWASRTFETGRGGPGGGSAGREGTADSWAGRGSGGREVGTGVVPPDSAGGELVWGTAGGVSRAISGRGRLVQTCGIFVVSEASCSMLGTGGPCCFQYQVPAVPATTARSSQTSHAFEVFRDFFLRATSRDIKHPNRRVLKHRYLYRLRERLAGGDLSAPAPGVLVDLNQRRRVRST